MKVKSMWICSLDDLRLIALLMLHCCLAFVTKGQPEPINTLAGHTWLHAGSTLLKPQ